MHSLILEHKQLWGLLIGTPKGRGDTLPPCYRALGHFKTLRTQGGGRRRVEVGGTAEGWWSHLVDVTGPTGGVEIPSSSSDSDIQQYGDGHGGKREPWPRGAQEKRPHPWWCCPVAVQHQTQVWTREIMLSFLVTTVKKLKQTTKKGEINL